jgi:hypothetical protein
MRVTISISERTFGLIGKVAGADASAAFSLAPDRPKTLGIGVLNRRRRAVLLCAALLSLFAPLAEAASRSTHAHASRPSAREERLLALTIWAEARSRGPKAMRSIGHVIVNRAHSGDYGEGIAGVVWKKGQFGCWRTRDPNRKAMRTLAALPKDGADWARWQEAKAIAHDLVRGAGADPTRGATHYAQTFVKPGWAKGSRHVATVAGYKFYKERPDAKQRPART